MLTVNSKVINQKCHIRATVSNPVLDEDKLHLNKPTQFIQELFLYMYVFCRKEGPTILYIKCMIRKEYDVNCILSSCFSRSFTHLVMFDPL